MDRFLHGSGSAWYDYLAMAGKMATPSDPEVIISTLSGSMSPYQRLLAVVAAT